MDINTVAKIAGVSRATVSRYFNDGYVSDEKRQAIAQAVAKTGYTPSQQAQTLRTGKTGLIGVILPKVNSFSVSRMLSGITQGFSATDYQMLLGNTANDKNDEIIYLNLFSRKNRVDGIILIATVLDAKHRKTIRALRCPIVVLGQDLKGYNSVFNDDYSSMYDLACRVLQHSKNPAYIGVIEEDKSAGHDRHRAFLNACKDCGLKPKRDAQRISAFTLDSGYLCAEEILEAHPETDTIMCASDTIAFGAMTCAREYGRRIPEDIQITGVGDTELTQVVTPSLTTVHYHYKTAGRQAAELLSDALQLNTHIPREICMGYELQIRSSTRI